MTSDERRRVILEALAKLSSGEADYAIFEDEQHDENYVQLGDFGPGKRMHIEVTSRNYGDEGIPPLTQDQVQALVKLGFSAETNPNHAADIESPTAEAVADLVEKGFAVLGTPLDVGIRVKFGNWQGAKGEPESKPLVLPDPDAQWWNAAWLRLGREQRLREDPRAMCPVLATRRQVPCPFPDAARWEEYNRAVNPLAKALYDCSGFTVHDGSVPLPEGGWMVGSERCETCVTDGRMRAYVADFAMRHADAIAEAGSYLAAWYDRDPGFLYLSVDRHAGDRDAAWSVAQRSLDYVVMYDARSGGYLRLDTRPHEVIQQPSKSLHLMFLDPHDLEASWKAFNKMVLAMARGAMRQPMMGLLFAGLLGKDGGIAVHRFGAHAPATGWMYLRTVGPALRETPANLDREAFARYVRSAIGYPPELLFALYDPRYGDVHVDVAVPEPDRSMALVMARLWRMPGAYNIGSGRFTHVLPFPTGPRTVETQRAQMQADGTGLPAGDPSQPPLHLMFLDPNDVDGSFDVLVKVVSRASGPFKHGDRPDA